MFGSIGMQELIIIFVVALIIFGPRRLPDLGKSLGKSIAEFKRASNELRSTLEDEIRVEEQKQVKSSVPAQDSATPAQDTATPAQESATPAQAATTAPTTESSDSPVQQD
jgi:TatA/E family protein of Tat protein translocase